ncbi:hypothetical protein AUJ13_03895 [Candidatus Micrarchaeota archaeon CG1_02_49_24]|nr:MAG: hypothetical protein AUJ13_03895 [Candidatus Micrarchaeota archaeon CG1_02_49_24]
MRKQKKKTIKRPKDARAIDQQADSIKRPKDARAIDQQVDSIKRPKDARAIDQQVNSIKRTTATPKSTPMAKIKFKLNVKPAPKPPKLPAIHHKHIDDSSRRAIAQQRDSIKQIKITLSKMHSKASARLKLAEHEVEDTARTLHDAIKKFKSIKF